MKKYILLLLFVSTELPGWSQPYHELKELKEKLSHSRADTDRVHLQLRLSNYYMNQSPFLHADSAAYFHDQALQLCIKLRDSLLYHKVLEEVGHRFFRARDYARTGQTFKQVIAWYHQTGHLADEARAWHKLAERYGHYDDSKYLNETISYFQRARSLYLQINQPIEAAQELTEIAHVRMSFKQLDIAEKELHQALDQFKKSGYQQLQLPYRYLYELHNIKGNYYRAMAFIMEAIKNMSVDGDSIQAPAYYMIAAECNYAVKKYEKAIEWLRKSAIRSPFSTLQFMEVQNLLALNRIAEARLILDSISEAERNNQYVDSLIQHWTLALYYKAVNNPQQAIRHYLRAKKVVDTRYYRSEQEVADWHIKCNNGIAEAYLKAHVPSKAGAYLRDVALLFKNSKTSLDPVLVVDYYGQLYRYNVATGNYAAAVSNLEKQVKINDSLFNADKDKQLAELNIQYETAYKEQSIKNLQSQGAAQEAKTAKATLQRNITIAGIIVMIAVSLLFYRNYQQKKGANFVISHKNALLERLVNEKEWLLKEVHHRVKNNLHTIISLMQSQALNLQDDALEANQISKNRIYAMSLIHQQLYSTENMKTIRMSVFLAELVDHLRESFGTERRILIYHTISPIELGISQAIPIALIVNETVTNAIKYAFPDDRPGNIRISMHQTGERITLTIADDGIGIDTAILKKETNSLGIKLLKGLTQEIDGSLTITNDNGTIINIHFNADPLNDLTLLPESETTSKYSPKRSFTIASRPTP